MTVEITFYVEETRVFQLTMGISEMYCKLFSHLPPEQLETWVCPEWERWVFTCKEFVEKVWYLCEVPDTLRKQHCPDRMKIVFINHRFDFT